MAGAPEVRARLVGHDRGRRAGLFRADVHRCVGSEACSSPLTRDCEARGAKLTIVDPSRCVVRLLALTGLDSVLGVRAESSAP